MVLVLGAVVHEQEQVRSRDALHQAVEQSLSLAVDPMEVFEDYEQRLDLGFPQEQPLQCVKGLLATLAWIESFPGGILDRHVQEPQQGGKGRLQCPVQGQQLPGYHLARLADIVLSLDLEISLEELDDWQERGRCPVGNRGRLNDGPAVGAMGVHDLPHEPALADPGFTDGCHDLTVSVRGPSECLTNVLQLAVAPDKTGQSPCRGSLEPRPNRSRAGELIYVDRSLQALDRNRPERLHLDETLGEPQRVRGQ